MNKGTVLVVEDDKAIQNLIGTTLEIFDYNYLISSNAKDGILKATSHNPDVIILDLGLPDMDGLEVIRKIRSFDLDSKYIQLEITESATIDNNEIFNLLEQFHTAGFKILLDDFGSGYSSLAALNRMHFDTIKLDKSLVDYIGDDNGEKLLNSITKLAQSFGMEITAEGVETVEQLMFLCNLDCDDIQGYYFSRPLPVKEYEECLKEACM